MGNIGSGELLVIFFVALMVLGPNKLPEAARQVGKAVNEVRRISGGFQREMREAMNEPIRAAEDAKNQFMDPFGQASSSASRGASGVPKTGSTDDDPPLPTASTDATTNDDRGPEASDEDQPGDAASAGHADPTSDDDDDADA
ncbi:MAG: Sec-independent protein translocase protein TatB [Actinomycetota bacterium]